MKTISLIPRTDATAVSSMFTLCGKAVEQGATVEIKIIGDSTYSIYNSTYEFTIDWLEVSNPVSYTTTITDVVETQTAGEATTSFDVNEEVTPVDTNTTESNDNCHRHKPHPRNKYA